METMRFPLKIGLAAMVLTVAGATHAQAQMRFQGMDRNNDNIITRDEWRGTDNAFRVQDWNGDGVLSGDEVRPGARRQTNWNQDWNRDGIVDRQDTLIAQRFREYDINGDNRLSSSEWPGNQALFRRLDADRNTYLTIAEYVNAGEMMADSQGGPAYRFSNLDINGDGWITRNEWNMTIAAFDRLDTNRDNRISNFEFQNDSTGVSQSPAGRVPYPTGSSQYPNVPFVTVDINRDGWITRSESGMTTAEFNRLDTNGDNRLSRYEFDAMSPDTGNSPIMNASFQNIDRNRDGWLTRTEWQWDDATFRRADTNNDSRISRFEFDAAAEMGNYTSGQGQYGDSQRTRAFLAGYDRGRAEGRVAGGQDFRRGQWDLEGQRELERADSGYSSQFGSLSEYQAGYRQGFRQAYMEGYNSR
jgi:hypothetical protein